ncbi:MAG: hypothetical protein E7576_14980 [Ruminococcaceae bacterium]|jgi:hypothetical protein|nr:hypothetical protein [Oscillospiraceae bacterium]
MKKTLLLLLSALMILSAFSSCGESAENTDPQSAPAEAAPAANEPGPGDTAPEEETEALYLDDGLGNPDLGGYEFRILSCFFNDNDTWRYVLFDEMTGTPLTDQLYDTKEYLEQRFNIKFTMIEPGDDAAAANSFAQSVRSGDDSFDMHIGKDWRTCDLGIKDYAYNLFEIDQFNFDMPWWPEETVRQLSIGKDLRAASNYASYCGIHWTRVMVFNKDLLADLQIEAPYDTVREGRWTIDELTGLTNGLSVDVNGNGKRDKGDTLALIGYGHTYYCLQEAAGVTAYGRDENKIPCLNLDVERIDGYVEKMRALLAGDDYLETGETDFVNGQAVFAFTEIRDAYNVYRDSDIRYGFLPQPKYDEVQEKYIACCTDCPWALPKTISSEQETIVGTVVEALSCRNYNCMLPVYLESTLKSRLADEPDDAEMLGLIADNRTISFAYSFNKLPFNNIISDCVFSNAEVASYLKRSEKVAQKALAKIIDAFGE